MPRLFLALIAVAGLIFAGCIDNANPLGSLSAGGGDNPILVGGGGNGNAMGGAGNGPGMGSGGVAGGATAVVSCRANGQEILLSKACQRAEDCVLISGSGSIAVPGTASTSCTTLTVGISRTEEARFLAFSAIGNCPPPVGGCNPSELKVQTEDGRVVPASAAIAAECDVDTCKSYAP